MRTVPRALLGALVFAAPLAFAVPVRAQVRDLTCYKTKDALKLAGTADLDTPQFGVDPGCKISKAKLFCVPATKTSVSVLDKATGMAISPLPLSRAPQPGDQICYKIKCPTPLPIADQVVTDEFGSRTLAKFKGSMLCTPAVKGVAYCGDGTIDAGEQCEPTDLAGASCTSLGFQPGTLTCGPGCTFDTSGCPAYPPPGSCGNGTVELGESCDGAALGGATCASFGYTGGTLACRASCAYDTSGCARTFPASGQTTCWNAAGTVIPCAGTGQDGDVQAGATLSYADNGDGTITDNNTRLVWEKLADDGSIHDKDDLYSWADAFAVKVAALNTVPCFAGFCDWRVPNRRELISLVNIQGAPAVSAAFNTGCAPSCTVLTCSCTNTTKSYWSSSTQAAHPTNAWHVAFGNGGIAAGLGKGVPINPLFVRAVRAGT